MTDEVYSILAKVFSISESEISDTSSPESIESWDSFNGLVLVDELESNFNIKFSISEITDVKNVADIKRHLKTRKKERVYQRKLSNRHLQSF